MNILKLILQNVRFFLKRLCFFGTRYKCPFCNSRLSQLLPVGFDFPVLKEKKVIGGGVRKNGLCPVCGSLDRERLIYLFLKRLNIESSSLILLHVAPERKIKNYIQQLDSINYITADISGVDVTTQMDITNIQYPDNHFDAIICNHVLEHIPDDLKAMGELYRVLKPNGWAILQVPFSLTLKHTDEDLNVHDDIERERRYGQTDHVRIYAKNDYVSKLKKAGFKVEIFNWWEEVGESHKLYEKSALLENEVLFLVRKP